MELPIIDDQGQRRATLAASDELFGREFNEAVVHQVVTAYMANARLGTRAQKARGEVNKSNKKPWRQKGTGRARAGRASSPLWRGGGKIFPSSPDENFSHKVNRKVYRVGIASILSQLVREGRLQVVESFARRHPEDQAAGAEAQGHGSGRGPHRDRQHGREPGAVLAQLARTYSWWSPGTPIRSVCCASRRRSSPAVRLPRCRRCWYDAQGLQCQDR